MSGQASTAQADACARRGEEKVVTLQAREYIYLVMNTLFISILAVCISAITALIAYFNYRLNKTLNIKNQIFNEKLKIYREMTQQIGKTIFYINKVEVVFRDHLKKGGLTDILNEMADKIDEDAERIHILMAESNMLAPDHILVLMLEFSDAIDTSDPQIYREDPLNHYQVRLENITALGEKLLNAFRADLDIVKLNKILQ